MKTKIKHWAIFLLGLLIGIRCCYLLYDFFDQRLNGVFADWFSDNFFYPYSDLSADSGHLVRDLNWTEFKGFVLTVLIVCVLAVFIIAFVAARVAERQAKKEVWHQTGVMLREYMASEKDAAEIFPKEYAEVAMQISEIKTAMRYNEQKLKEEASRKNDLITYLAHDLKTPLTSIIGYLSLLDEIPEMPEKQRARYTTITLEKAQRLEKLINEFFDITRYNLQQVTLEKEVIDLHYMLIQMADEFYPIFHAHGNTAELDVEENIKVMADSIKLARVFNNILKNAVAYSYPDTPIRITAKTIGDEVHISFSNQGKTIPEHKLNVIFDKFFRLDEARTSNTGGAGLGLAIAREIITLHGGSVVATSTDGVTVFDVKLPAI